MQGAELTELRTRCVLLQEAVENLKPYRSTVYNMRTLIEDKASKQTAFGPLMQFCAVHNLDVAVVDSGGTPWTAAVSLPTVALNADEISPHLPIICALVGRK